MVDGFQVRPDELAGAGSSALALAARVPAQADQLAAATGSAATGLTGWRTAAALRSCGDAWRALLVRLSQELAHQGNQLTATANQYRSGELAAADAFTHSLAGR
jgi:hypothetical protein